MTKVGEHITLDIIGTTKEYDPSLFEKVIIDIAKVCKLENINFRCFKFISDNADETAGSDWLKNCQKGAELFKQKLKEISLL